jgi:hypothetical protein
MSGKVDTTDSSNQEIVHCDAILYLRETLMISMLSIMNVQMPDPTARKIISSAQSPNLKGCVPLVYEEGL